ncbi:MAG: class I SAM-dependent methyltransferase [Candidatus Desantisbacteria bacterium]
MKCKVCGFIYVQNVTSKDIDNFYEKDYFDGKTARFNAETNINHPISETKKWLIKKYLDMPGYKNILEIGPGPEGGMIKYFKADTSRKIQCIEISKYASDYLNNNGIPTFNGKIYDFKTKEKYDLIIATEVIEHELNPQLFIETILNLLNDGGMFFFSTGNTNGLCARKNGKNWYYWDPPAHISYFNNKCIKLLLKKSGFGKIKAFNAGFSWINLFRKLQISAFLPIFSKLQISTGMLVFGYKK